MISCIVPTFNNFKYVFEALDSILFQKNVEFEIIITDDGSKNFPIDEIKEYFNRNNFNNYVIIHNETNVGTVINLDNAIRKARGEYIVPLSNDDKFYDENVLFKIANKLKENDIIVCQRKVFSEDMNVFIRNIPADKNIKKIKNKLDDCNKQYISLGVGSTYEMASGSAMYFKKTFFEKVNGYDRKYKLWEDGPFISKITKLGFKLTFCYDIVSIKYRQGGISSNQKKTINSLIHYDYLNFYKSYIEDKSLNVIQRNIVSGRYNYLKNKCNYSIIMLFKYPFFFIHQMIWKFRR